MIEDICNNFMNQLTMKYLPRYVNNKCMHTFVNHNRTYLQSNSEYKYTLILACRKPNYEI